MLCSSFEFFGGIQIPPSPPKASPYPYRFRSIWRDRAVWDIFEWGNPGELEETVCFSITLLNVGVGRSRRHKGRIQIRRLCHFLPSYASAVWLSWQGVACVFGWWIHVLPLSVVPSLLLCCVSWLWTGTRSSCPSWALVTSRVWQSRARARELHRGAQSLRPLPPAVPALRSLTPPTPWSRCCLRQSSTPLMWLPVSAVDLLHWPPGSCL